MRRCDVSEDTIILGDFWPLMSHRKKISDFFFFKAGSLSGDGGCSLRASRRSPNAHSVTHFLFLPRRVGWGRGHSGADCACQRMIVCFVRSDVSGVMGEMMAGRSELNPRGSIIKVTPFDRYILFSDQPQNPRPAKP